MSDLKKQKRWVVWMAEKITANDGSARTTKIPYTVRGKKASSTNPDDWSTYKEAKAALKNFGDGIGIVFTPDQNLLGIDIDHVLLPEQGIEGTHAAAITRLIEEAATYTEVSPSGTGIHLYLALDAGLALAANRKSPFEAYTSGRFFTFTEHAFGDKRPVRTVSPDEAVRLLGIIGYPWGKGEAAAPSAAALLEGPLMDDEELTRRMFGSKHGETIRALWDGDTSAYDGDTSRADAALLNHLSFWSRKDAAQMERLWQSSPLGAREKTRKRADYRKTSIANAIASTKQVYESPTDATAGIDFLTTKSPKGDDIIVQNVENVCRLLRAHPEFAGTLRKDLFGSVFEIQGTDAAGTRTWRPFEDVDALHIMARISILFPFFRRIGKDMVYDAILKVLDENAYDSAVDFVRSIEWDKKARLDTWLGSVYGAPDNEYHRAVASNWLKGMVKRILDPGCKFDYVLVLEGEQGARKSTSLHILGQLANGRNMHVETTMSTDSKDFFMQMKGKAIVEFSEGETLSRTEVKKMKAIITMQSDTYRPPYSRVSQDFPRRCVFAMTTNQDEYLKDETGNRRWLPVRVKDKADIEWLAANRDQLVAEARVRVLAGETLYEFPEEATKAEQEARRVSSPNEERIVHWYMNMLTDQARMQGITIMQVYSEAMGGFASASLKKFEEMEIADILKRVIKLEKRRKMVGGVQSMRWYNPRTIDLDSLADPVELDEFGDPLHGRP